MTAAIRRNFRGHRALIACAAEQDRAVLVQLLGQLGITTAIQNSCCEQAPDAPFDLVFFDDEAGRQFGGVERLIDTVQAPAIALIGSDAPSSVNWVIERRVCGYLTKPLRKAGILASLIIAYHAFNERNETELRLQRLEQQVRARQIVCTAAIEIVEGLDISVNDAFKLLRASSMSRRLSVEDLAAMIVSGEMTIAALTAVHRPKQKPG
ncbi:MAG: ANTAR domain-containing protein [Halomonas sp.]|nr:ANTAR domain-containing protein [Halomonas sp.]TVP45311.1 MAG: ANTAR domain-containing protein [Halomonas sp.]